MLKKVDRKLEIDQRFKKEKVFADIAAGNMSKNKKVIKMIEEAYAWLSNAVKQVEPISNAYYNYSKACIYCYLFVERGKTKNNK